MQLLFVPLLHHLHRHQLSVILASFTDCNENRHASIGRSSDAH